jgi:plastocyanin
MKKFAAMFALLLAALALVACGGSDDSTTGAGEETAPAGKAGEVKEDEKEAEGGTAGSSALEFEADPSGNLAYTTDSATSKAGKVTVNFTNTSPVPHDVAIEDSGGETIGKTEVLAEGSDSTSVSLKAGEYKFYCSVPGHRQAGMEGTLTVE